MFQSETKLYLFSIIPVIQNRESKDDELALCCYVSHLLILEPSVLFVIKTNVSYVNKH